MRVLNDFIRDYPNRPFVVPTYLAPHAASPEYKDLASYLEALCSQLDEIILESNWIWDKPGYFCSKPRADIFIEEGYFSSQEGKSG